MTLKKLRTLNSIALTPRDRGQQNNDNAAGGDSSGSDAPDEAK